MPHLLKNGLKRRSVLLFFRRFVLRRIINTFVVKEISENCGCSLFFLFFHVDTKPSLTSQMKPRLSSFSLWVIFGFFLITDLDSFHRSVGADKSRHQSVFSVRGSRWRCGTVLVSPSLSLALCLPVLTGRCRCEALLSRISMLTSQEVEVHLTSQPRVQY